MSSNLVERDWRRREVSRIRLEYPGATVREITHKLAENGFRNPETGEPWSRATVQRDLEHLRERTRERADRNADEWLRRELSMLEHLEERSLKEEGIQSVHAALAVQRRRSKLLCLDREMPIGSEDSSSRIDKLIEVIEMIREEEDLSRFDDETWADETSVDLDASDEAPIHPNNGRDPSSPSTPEDNW